MKVTDLNEIHVMSCANFCRLITHFQGNREDFFGLHVKTSSYIGLTGTKWKVIQ